VLAGAAARQSQEHFGEPLLLSNCLKSKLKTIEARSLRCRMSGQEVNLDRVALKSRRFDICMRTNCGSNWIVFPSSPVEGKKPPALGPIQPPTQPCLCQRRVVSSVFRVPDCRYDRLDPVIGAVVEKYGCDGRRALAGCRRLDGSDLVSSSRGAPRPSAYAGSAGYGFNDLLIKKYKQRKKKRKPRAALPHSVFFFDTSPSTSRRCQWPGVAVALACS
jgi:hypothetical protein